ncbi:MAG: hypothetical protein HFH41_06815 [Lachnospiraceae bacterium]|nr:hypothetical protein [Lachnospiraceae bacterium]
MAKEKHNACCGNRSGMNVSRAMGAGISDSQVKDLLNGKTVSVETGISTGETNIPEK